MSSEKKRIRRSGRIWRDDDASADEGRDVGRDDSCDSARTESADDGRAEDSLEPPPPLTSATRTVRWYLEVGYLL